jgi:hypothetical protein
MIRCCPFMTPSGCSHHGPASTMDAPSPKRPRGENVVLKRSLSEVSDAMTKRPIQEVDTAYNKSSDFSDDSDDDVDGGGGTVDDPPPQRGKNNDEAGVQQYDSDKDETTLGHNMDGDDTDNGHTRGRKKIQCDKCGYETNDKSKLKRHQQGPNCGSTPTSRMIDKSKEKWPGLFTYEKMEYFKGKITNICCKKHGLFDFQNHLTTSFGGCPECVAKPNFDDFVKRARSTHDDEYEYDRNSFVNMNSVVCMKHIKCGAKLEIKASDHVRSTGCLECWKNPTPLDIVITDLSTFKGRVLPHPVHKNYGWAVDKERIINFKTQQMFSETQKRKGWYKEITLINYNNRDTSARISTSEHRFKYECFHKVDATGYEIDHRNDNHNDDSIQNLQRLTKRDHGRRTSASKNGETARKISKTQGHSGVAFNPGTGQEVEFDSITQLAQKINNSPANIHRFLRTEKNPPGGFSEITFDTHDALPDEIFKKHPDWDFEVSNKGRVRDRRRITKGFKDSYGYNIYSGKRISVLLVQTFKGPKPSEIHTADHKNRDRGDDDVDNLQWATPEEQVMNQSNKHIWFVVNGFTAEVKGRFSRLSDLCEVMNITIGNIHTVSGNSRSRQWFIFHSHYMLRRKRIEFVKKRLMWLSGKLHGRTWSTVASGFFKNCDTTKRKMEDFRPTIGPKCKSNFEKQNAASNCIKFHYKSWLCFRRLDIDDLSRLELTTNDSN